jgi:isoleucyl-tRNA synthetase
LTNWYIRRSRRRFWDEKPSQDRDEAFATLYQVLVELTKIAAPFVPFISETIYRNLRSKEMPDSVHLCDYPPYHKERRDEALEDAMEAVQITASLGHSLRKEHKLKVRQPLSTAHIASGDQRILHFLKDQQHLIADELNVKNVTFGEDETELVALRAKANFRILGKKVGKLMKAAQTAVESLDQHQLAKILDGGTVDVNLEGTAFTLTSEDVLVDRVVHEGMIAANSGHITIALETNLTDDLLLEGLSRELVNKINTMRREADFAVTDRIHLRLQTTERVKKCFEVYNDAICGEVLALSVKFAPCEGTVWDLNGEPTTIALTRAKQ